MKSKFLDEPPDSYYVIEYGNGIREMYDLLEFEEFKLNNQDNFYTVLTEESVSQEEAENMLDRIISGEND